MISKNKIESPNIQVRRSAMDFLARREHSFEELKTKLSGKFSDFALEDIILPELRKLKEENLQSDSRFVEAYIRYRRTRGVGPLKIASELQQKGADNTLVKSELYLPENDWQSLCQQVLEKKYARSDNQCLSQKELLRRQRFLAQRGFSNNDIKLALESFLL